MQPSEYRISNSTQMLNQLLSRTAISSRLLPITLPSATLLLLINFVSVTKPLVLLIFKGFLT